MTRTTTLASLALLAGLLAVVLLAPDARAHGGSFREDAPQGPDIPAPELGSTRDPPVTTGRATWTVGSWHTWWMLQRDSLLPDKPATRRRSVSAAQTSLFGTGRPLEGFSTSRYEHELEKGATDVALPFLLDVLDPMTPHDHQLVAAALIALGRTVRGPAPVRIFSRYATDPAARQEVRESAVLGLGLLRRSEHRDQQDPATLRDIRRFLLDLFDDERAPTRVRAFAALSLGFLADQPHGADAFERDGRATTRALWLLLERPYANGDLPVALLTALGMQPREGVPAGVLTGLKTMAMGQPCRGRAWKGLLRSHALSAYARLRAPGWSNVMLWALRGTRDHVAVRCAAAIALARGAGELDADERHRVAVGMVRWVHKEPNWFAGGLQYLALAELLHAELLEGGSRLVDELHVDRLLRRAAIRGRSMARPYCRLALGMAVRGLEPDTRTNAEVLRAFRTVLEQLLRTGRGADDALGACAVALGLAGAANAYGLLLEILEDRTRGAGLRGHCAVALAHIGADTPSVRAALLKAASERLSPQVHVGAVRALSVLAVPEAATQLLAQLDRTRSRYTVAVAAGALGRLGDPQATERLVAMAGDKVESLMVRIMSIVALGLIFDPEPRPSRVLFSAYANYPARTPALTQVFNIQ